MDQLKFFVPTLFGLEGLAADELRRLSLADVRAENGHVLCTGRPGDIPRLNLNLRTGERVLLVLGSFPAPDFDALFEGVRAIPWEEYLPRTAAFPVKGHSLNSALHSVPACQSIVKKAAAARLGKAYGLETLPENGPLFQIQFSIMKDTATIMLDTSGAGLHKRGYRAWAWWGSPAGDPGRRHVMLSQYRGRDPFCDPFCGSGTIAIEAALIARNRAPGLDRSFSAQKWPWLSSQAWMDAASEAMDREFDGQYDIWGGDIDPKAVEIARSNAEKAGVDDLVRFDVADATRFHRSEPYGRVVTNPPYGERIMEKREAEGLYEAFARRCGAACRVAGVRPVLPHRVRAHLRPHRRQKRKLYNGMIKCDLFQYNKR